VNISLGGCLLAIEPRNNHSFQTDCQIELTLSIEGGKVIEVAGVIRRVLSVHQQKEFSLRVGVEFQRLSSHEESRINEIVMKCYRVTNRFGSRLRSM
jgi:c-di-GMP-binding flagellar brake protein YcgR